MCLRDRHCRTCVSCDLNTKHLLSIFTSLLRQRAFSVLFMGVAVAPRCCLAPVGARLVFAE